MTAIKINTVTNRKICRDKPISITSLSQRIDQQRQFYLQHVVDRLEAADRRDTALSFIHQYRHFLDLAALLDGCNDCLGFGIVLRIVFGEKAVECGLIDSVGTLGDAIDKLRELIDMCKEEKKRSDD